MAIQGLYCQNYGISAGFNTQGRSAVAIGNLAGQNTQGSAAVAIGNKAGYNTQGSEAVAIGNYAGRFTQGYSAVAIGNKAGYNTQGGEAVAIGTSAGAYTQGIQAVAIGAQAGRTNQGENAIAIGRLAGTTNQMDNSIVINATGSHLSGQYASALFVKTVRSTAEDDPVLIYDTTTGEIKYNNNTDKTFVIQHPTNEDKYLVHACLEGPEAGVYYRGKAEIPKGQTSVEVTLPDYIDALATDFTVHITPIYNGTVRTLNASEIENNKFTVYGSAGPFSWLVNGKRSSIEIEPNKADVNLKGEGPYRWIE